ncbi:DNA polymerase epsilon catalytic subunit A [Carex rostrata]
MGSLMAGWDAPIMDEYTARAQRNKSLTKEEINSFWKSQREKNERGMNFSPQFLNDNERRREATPFSHSQNDVWSIMHPHCVPNSPRTYESTDEIAHKSNMPRDWWTRSNSAFLNEAPRDEMHGVASNYTPQFNVAQLAQGNA